MLLDGERQPQCLLAQQREHALAAVERIAVEKRRGQQVVVLVRRARALVHVLRDQVQAAVLAQMDREVREGVERGEFRSVDPFVTARIIVSQLVHHAVWTSRRELFPHLGARTDDELLQEMKAFVSAALLPPEAEAR